MRKKKDRIAGKVIDYSNMPERMGIAPQLQKSILEEVDLESVLDNIEKVWQDGFDYKDMLKLLPFSKEVKQKIVDMHWLPAKGEKNFNYIKENTHSGFHKLVFKRILILLHAKALGNTLPRNEDMCVEITSACNKKCLHCYMHEKNLGEFMNTELLHSLVEYANQNMLSLQMIGGEPMLDKRLVPLIRKYPTLIFYVVSNGVRFSDRLIHSIRNEIHNFQPILSLEGFQSYNDSIRGIGSFSRTVDIMKKLKKLKIPYQTDTIITTKNINSVLSDDYMNFLMDHGPWGVGLYKYRPVEGLDHGLSLSKKDLDLFEEKINEFLHKYPFRFFHEEPIHIANRRKTRVCKGLLTITVHGHVKMCPSIHKPTLTLQCFNRDEVANVLDTWYNIVGVNSPGCPLFFNTDSIKNFYQALPQSRKTCVNKKESLTVLS